MNHGSYAGLSVAIVSVPGSWVFPLSGPQVVAAAVGGNFVNASGTVVDDVERPASESDPEQATTNAAAHAKSSVSRIVRAMRVNTSQSCPGDGSAAR